MVFACSPSALRSLHSRLLYFPTKMHARKTEASAKSPKMKSKHSASTLKEMSLSGSLVGCEMRSFAANHCSVLDASNHMDYVEAFILQIGQREQHEKILSLLSSMDRAF